MDSTMLEEALSLLENGNFKESRNKFEAMVSKASTEKERKFCLFNISSCHAKEANYEVAMSCMDKLDQEDSHDFDKNALIHNRILCRLEMFRYRNAKVEDNHEEEAAILEQMIDDLSRIDRYNEYFESSHELIKSFIDQIATDLWSKSKYLQLDRLIQRARQIVSDTEDQEYHAKLQANLGHTLFMMDNRFEDTIQLYESLLPEGEESLLSVDSDVLANLCVSYVLTGRNMDAEQLIKETELAQAEYQEFDYGNESRLNSRALIEPSLTHLDKINLVIGTLYCVKGNYQFGLGRIFKTMEPMREKLNAVGWFQAKRCILALLSKCCKQTLSLSDGLCEVVVKFLIDCEKFGDQLVLTCKTNNDKSPSVEATQEGKASNAASEQRTIAAEAAYLRSLMIAVIHD